MKKGIIRQGFWFGLGFTTAAYIVMFFMGAVGEFCMFLFGIMIQGLGV